MNLNDAFILAEETPLTDGKTGLIVFDIDDTLLHADSSIMGIIIQHFTETGKWENVDREDTAQFAKSKYKDENGRAKPGYRFDFSEYRDPEKIKQSMFKTHDANGKQISKGAEPLVANLRMMDSNLRAGYKVAFLTARGAEAHVFANLMKWLKYRKTSGELVDLRKERFNLDDSRAVNDSKYENEYKGMTDGQKKASFLKDKCSKYTKVKFVDDDKSNLAAMRALKLPNLQVIEAHSISENSKVRNR